MMVRMKTRYLDNAIPNLTQNADYEVITLGNHSGQIATILNDIGVLINVQLQSAADWEIVLVTTIGSEQIYP